MYNGAISIAENSMYNICSSVSELYLYFTLFFNLFSAMAFKLKDQPKRIDPSQIDTELGKLNRNTGAGNFNAGDKFTLGRVGGSGADKNKIKLDIRLQEWEQTNEQGAVVRSGAYPVIVVPVGNFVYADGSKNTEEVFVPMSSFCTRVAFNNDIHGVRPKVTGRYPQRYQYADIKKALSAENPDTEFKFNVVEYSINGSDGVNTQPRSLAACA